MKKNTIYARYVENIKRNKEELVQSEDWFDKERALHCKSKSDINSLNYTFGDNEGGSTN